LNDIEAREHPIFRELIRVRQYFEKVKDAEIRGMKPATKLDKVAASRFIKYTLVRRALP